MVRHIIRVGLLFMVLMILLGQAAGLAAHTDNVRDYLDYLNADELREVQSLIEQASAAYNLDIVIVFTDNTEGKSSRDYADDYYDYHGYGLGNDFAGLLMLVNMTERELWVSTAGRAIDIFTDTRINDMTDAVAPYLTAARYYDACSAFVGQVEYYAQRGIPSGQYRAAETTYWQRVLGQMRTAWIYWTAFIIAILLTIIFSIKAKEHSSQQTYEEEGSFQLTSTQDDYIRETTTRVRVASNTTGGGSGGSAKSSSHRGSSGRSHGGGGRKF